NALFLLDPVPLWRDPRVIRHPLLGLPNGLAKKRRPLAGLNAGPAHRPIPANKVTALEQLNRRAVRRRERRLRRRISHRAVIGARKKTPPPLFNPTIFARLPPAASPISFPYPLCNGTVPDAGLGRESGRIRAI